MAPIQPPSYCGVEESVPILRSLEQQLLDRRLVSLIFTGAHPAADPQAVDEA